MSSRHLDLALVFIVAVAELGLSFIPNFAGPARVLVGLPAVVFVPGYALTAAIWPAGGLQSIERFALSLGLSLALATLAGLLLYATGVGLRPVPWAVVLAVPTVVGSVIALGQRRSSQATGTHGVMTDPTQRLTWRGSCARRRGSRGDNRGDRNWRVERQPAGRSLQSALAAARGK